MEKITVSNVFVDYYYGDYRQCWREWSAYDEICSYSKIYYIIDGECELIIAGKKYTGTRGSIFLIPAGVKHSYYHINENLITKYWFHFNLECGENDFFSMVNLPYHANISINRGLIKRFEQIYKLADSPAIAKQLLLKSEILGVIGEYIDITGCRETEVQTEDSKNLEIIKMYITDNISRSINLDELAQIVHFHPNYLIRFFKSKMGMTPMKYIMHLKIEKAKALLEHSSLPIKEISESLGFTDVAHFYKRFKEQCGYSPGEFRKIYTKNKISDN